MKVCTCFLLFRIFAYTNSIAQNSEYKSSVILAQETDQEFRNKDTSGDEKISDNEENFLERDKTVNENDEGSRSPRPESFTGFIQQAINILNTYEYTAFEDFFDILDDEIRKYHYKGCKFHELTENYETRRLLAAKLDLIKGKPVSVTKVNINALAHMIRDEIYDRNIKEFLDYINSLYRRDAELKFHKVLNDLEYYRNLKAKRNNNNLVKIVRDGVRSIIFDHYTELNTKARQELKDRIQTFWKHFRETSSSTAKINFNTYTTSDSQSDMNTVNNPENHSTEDIEHEQKEVQQQQQTNTKTAIFINKENMRDGELTDVEIGNEQNQDEETTLEASENDKTNNKTQSQAYISSDEILSGESFDTSSNSIALSQDRHREYNKQRYMTLYTEEMSYRSKTTREPEISHNFAKAMAETPMVQKVRAEEVTRGLPMVPTRSTTTLGPRRTPKYESSLSDESRVWSKLRIKNEQNNEIRRVRKLALKHDTDDDDTDDDTKQYITDNSSDDMDSGNNNDKYELKNKRTPAKSISMNKKHNKRVFGHKIVDGKSTNVDFYKHKGMFDPVEMNVKYGVALHAKFVVPTNPVPIRPVIPPRGIRIRAEISRLKLTPSTKSTVKFSKGYKFTSSKKYYKDSRKSIAPPLRSNQGISIKKNNKDGKKTQKFPRKSKSNDTSDIKTSNDVNKRINDLERELNELKKIAIFRSNMNDTSTDGDEVNSVTDEAIDNIEQDENKGKHATGDVNIKFVNGIHKNNKIGSRDNNSRHEYNLTRKGTKSYSSAAETTTNTKASTTIKSTSAKPVSTTIIIVTSPKPPEIIKKDEVHTTINDNKDKLDKKTSEITSIVTKTTVNATKTYTKEVNEAAITNNVTASTVSQVTVTKLHSVVTFPTVPKTEATILYSEPPYFDRRGQLDQYDQFDPFDHIKDGFDLGK